MRRKVMASTPTPNPAITFAHGVTSTSANPPRRGKIHGGPLAFGCRLVVMTLAAGAAICTASSEAQSVPVNWTSEGTFDVTSFPLGTAVNTFSTSAPFALNDVHFGHTVNAREDGSLRLFGGVFEIAATGGDVLRGTYEDFIYGAPSLDGIYQGSGPFNVIGGTGQFARATGQGSWNATARFTSNTGGTADHIWQGRVNLAPPPIPFRWSSEGIFDVTNFPLGTAVNAFSSSSPFDLKDVQFSHTVEARDDCSLRLFWGTFEIAATTGDVLRGTYEDFIYNAPSDKGVYLGSGAFELTGGTGQFAGAAGQGSWNASAQFTSNSGGTADHVWEGSVSLVPQPMPFTWTSEGTFDVTGFPLGTAVNTFSSSSPLDLNDVNFSHTVNARDDGSLRLFGGTFEIFADNGDALRGTYEDFIYSAPDAGEIYRGSGPFEISGGTGQFAGASGQGSWSAMARFTSDSGGTADHIWQGSLTILPAALMPPLQPGDADQDLNFDERDLVRVQQAAKFLSGQVATWGEGDFNGAPGGRPGSPPAGNGLFDQLDIVAALRGGTYSTGPYAALAGPGMAGDGQASIVYHAGTGELAVDAPAGTQLTSINIDSAAGIFTGDAAQNLGGSFDNDSDNNIFKATFGSSFGSLSYGNVAQPGLAESLVLSDLSVVGSLAGGGALGDVDLIYVPEPSAAILILLGALGVFAWRPLGAPVRSTWQ